MRLVPVRLRNPRLGSAGAIGWPVSSRGMLYPMPVTTQHLLDLVADPTSVADLRTYFGCGLPAGEVPSYTGGRFESLEGGGIRPETVNLITAGDLVAVQMLSVRVPRGVTLDLLDGPLGRAVGALRADIDPSVELGTPAAGALLAEGGPAERAWKLLKKQEGMGWVTTGKLLARKRPMLIPVYDRVVRCTLGTHGLPSFWLWLNARFSENQRELPGLLADTRRAADADEAVSAARVLDVIVWMRHHGSHRESRCGRVDLPEVSGAA